VPPCAFGGRGRRLTEAYIDYNRRDVLATAELATAELATAELAMRRPGRPGFRVIRFEHVQDGRVRPRPAGRQLGRRSTVHPSRQVQDPRSRGIPRL
jgi:hypothetical protein